MSESDGRESAFAVAVGAAGLGFVGLAVGLFFGLAAGIALAVPGAPGHGTPTGIALSTIAQGAGLIAVGVVYVAARGLPWSYLRVYRPSFRDAVWTVVTPVVLLACFLLLLVLARGVGLAPTEHSVQRLAQENPAILLPLIPLSVLVTGPAEEFVYRGLIQTRLKEVFSTGVAVLLAALVFALVHVPAYGVGTGFGPELVTTLVMLFVLGSLLGLVYEQTGNLLVPALAHGFYNAVVFAQQYVQVAGLPV